VTSEPLISEELPDATRGKDSFNLLDKYFRENDLEWGKLVGCTTDSAPSMLVKNQGFKLI